MELSLLILFAFCLLVQVYYSLRYFGGLIQYRSQEPTHREEIPVTIVVAARNEADNLPLLLQRLKSQDYSNYEVIVVNDRSEDGTEAILKTFSGQFPKLRYINIDMLPDGWNGKKHALKRGIEAARNEVILLTDADCVPKSDHWVSEMSGAFDKKTDFVLGFSPYEEKPGFLNHFIRFETLWTGIQYLSFAIAHKPYMGVGRNLAYRKRIFLNDGFKNTQHITGGDDDLLVNAFANKSNTEIMIDQSAQCISVPKKTWASYLTQKTRHLSVGKEYRQKDRTRLGIFALCNLFGWFLLFYLLFAGHNIGWILTMFGFRSTLFYIIFTRTGRKLGVRILPFTLPLLDLFYNLFYLVVGLRVLAAKRIKWS